MFSSISWHDFLVTVIVLMVVYYLIVLCLFYRNDIALLFRKRFPGTVIEEEKPELFAGVGDLLNDLKTIFAEAADRQYHREELMQALRSQIKNYQQLKDTPFVAAVNNHIQQSAISFCNISLADNEVQQLW